MLCSYIFVEIQGALGRSLKHQGDLVQVNERDSGDVSQRAAQLLVLCGHEVSLLLHLRHRFLGIHFCEYKEECIRDGCNNCSFVLTYP